MFAASLGPSPFDCHPTVISRKNRAPRAYFEYNAAFDYESPSSHAIAAPGGFCCGLRRNRVSRDRCCLVASRWPRLRGRLSDLLPRCPYQRCPWGFGRCASRAGARCMGSAGRKASFLRRPFRRKSALSSSTRLGINKRPGQPVFAQIPFLSLPTR